MVSHFALRTTACALLLAACGGTDDRTEGGSSAATCAVGEGRPCACADGSEATQVCADDGASFGPCACDPTGDGTGASGSGDLSGPTTSGGGSSDPGEPPVPSETESMDPGPAEPPPTEPPASGEGVQVSGVACGGVLDANLKPPFVELGGRQVYIDYACNKAPGTPTTFILNLHGTMGLEDGKIYQRGYLPSYQFVDSHDFIVATPKSVVSQWGNGDGGQDLPHLLETVEWVYSAFAELDIRQMWVVGHSWGAFYARTFVCRSEFEGRAAGVVLMSGGSSAPSCGERLSIIGTVGETDIVAGEVDQSAAAAAHGCAGSATHSVGNTTVTAWPNCTERWVHRNYFMHGKGHGFSPDDWPEPVMIEDLVDAIRSAR
jgi:pimeloyl-ACP methyl ester carboxylesterase